MLTPRAIRTAAVVVALLTLPLLLRPATPAPDVAATLSVDGVVIPVANLERAVDFYSRVLSFERVGDTELTGEVYDRLHGVAALRARVARLRLGRETIELVEYVTPRGRPVPPDSRSQDRWFQHVAIIVNDMEQAYLWLRRHGVERTSPEPQRLPDWNPNAGGIWAFTSRTRTAMPSRCSSSPRQGRRALAGAERQRVPRYRPYRDRRRRHRAQPAALP